MKKSLSMLSCALLITTAFAFFATNAVASEPEIGFPEDDGGFVSGTGRCFEVTDSTYLNVTLCSSEVVNVTLRSVPKVVSFTIRTETSALPTDIDMSGFESGKTHYRYEDGHLVESFTADEEGNHSYTQDLSK
ncbi:MAG: hypothetical protein ACE5IO_09360, partial [Thermoplasmata archaeon]